MRKLNDNDRQFYRLMFTIAFPVIIQNAISMGLNMLDVLMIGRIGTDAVSAVGIANRIYFIFSTACFGIYSGASIFVAQFWGVGDIKSIRKVVGIDLMMGGVMSLLLTIAVIAFPAPIMAIFIKDEVVIGLAVDYIRIVAFSYFFTAISFAYSFNCRAIHRLTLPTVVNAVALVINTVLNFVLIYGKLGLPALGVKGAAIATLIARGVEFILMISITYKDREHPIAARLSDIIKIDFEMFKNVLRTSLPVIISETSWSLGTSVYFIAYGMMGSVAVAVVNISTTISDMFQCFFFGVGNASAVMIGNELGRNNLNVAYDYGKRYIAITFILNIIFSILLFLSKGFIIGFYGYDVETSMLLNKALIVFSIYLTPKMFTYLIICGILRAGGDTRYCMMLDIVCVWLIGVPLSFFSVMVLKLPIYLVMAAVFSEEIVKLFLCIARFKSQKWINNLIL